MRVLVVDDEEIICESIKADIGRMKHPWEYQVQTANSVSEAELIYESSKPQILITDINMPGGSGLLLVEKARKKMADCGILVLSAYDDFGYVRNAFMSGADDYILKPVAFSELQNHIYKLARKISSMTEETEVRKEENIEEKDGTVMAEIVEYIKEHAADRLSAAELAKKAALSYNNFGKAFREYTGMSFSSYLHWYRMELAKEYLSNPAIKIKDVAAKVGYQNAPQHFSRDFTKQTGLSPKEYRLKMN